MKFRLTSCTTLLVAVLAFGAPAYAAKVLHSRVRLDFHDLEATACAGRRLALAETVQDADRVIAVDTDTLFLRPLDDLWRLFDGFEPGQASAAAPGLALLDLREIRAAGGHPRLDGSLSSCSTPIPEVAAHLQEAVRRVRSHAAAP
jgi:hypothetical protein